MIAVNNKSDVQDNGREIRLANLFGLTRGTSRIDIDAFDTIGNPWELKTTSKKSVSTARDLGPNHLAKWRERYWLIATGRNTPEEFRFERFFFLAPEHMEPWYRKIEKRFAFDLELAEVALAALPDDFPARKRAHLERMLHRGMLLNDPNIPWRYVEQNGIEIVSNHADRLLELTKLYPLDAVTFNVGMFDRPDDDLFTTL